MATLNAANLTLVIKATNDAAKVLKSVEGQLQQIVGAAQAANDAMAQIAETAAPAMATASQAVAAAQNAAVPAIDTQGMAAAVQSASEATSFTLPPTDGLAKVGEVIGTVSGQAVDFLTTLGGMRGGILALQSISGTVGNAMEGFGLRLTSLQNPMNLARGGFSGLAGLGGTLRTAMSGIGMAAATAAGPLGALASGGFTRLAALGASLIPVIRGVGAALMTVAMNPVGLIVTALVGLVAAGIAIWQNWDTISAKALEIWNWIGGFLGSVMDGITGKFNEVWNGITGFFSGIWEGLIGIVTEHWDKILAVIFPVVGLPVLIAKNWGAITEKVGEIWSMVVGTVQEWWNKLVGILFPEEGGLLGMIREKWGMLVEAVGEIWGQVVGKVQEWWDSLVAILFPEEGGLVSMIADSWGGLVEVVGGIWNGVTESFKAGINSVIGLLNQFIGYINRLKIQVPKIDVKWVGTFGGFTVGFPRIPSIPTLDAGGIVMGPTLAALAMNNRPEAVIPLGRRGAGIAPTINVTIVNRGTIVHDRQFVDLVTRAYHISQRMGRVP